MISEDLHFVDGALKILKMEGTWDFLGGLTLSRLKWYLLQWVMKIVRLIANFSKLQAVESISPDDVCKAFIIFTEMLLARSKDPRSPKACQFIDLSGVTISSGFRVDMLKKIYRVFEPNYPETLSKMVMYPVSTMLATTARTLLNFVNEKTQRKFVITNSLAVVCEELGWDQSEVEACGGVTEFMHKHETAGTQLILE